MKINKNYLPYLIVFAICIAAFFLCIGSYQLLDPDETRYVDMAKNMFNSKDYMTLYLNNEYFFEKPPLFFWIECFGFKIFHTINELTARFPIVLLSFLPVGLLFNLCKKVKNTEFAFVSSIILLTSLEYIFISKIAILDSVLTTFATSAVIAYFYTFFVKNENKKYFWLLCYLFTGFAVMAKGIPGIAIPFGIIFFATIIFKTYKETFKYLPFGLFLVCLIVLPWHILMIHKYPNLFYDEYIYKHHILRFLGSEVIDRKEPFYFYFLTLLWGFFPHILIFISKIIEIIVNKIKSKNYKFNYNFEDNFDKFIVLNIITSLFIILFFTSSGTKLVTYILPIYPSLAVLSAKFWSEYIEKDNKSVKRILFGFSITFIIASIVLCFSKLVIENSMYQDFKYIQILSIILIFLFMPYMLWSLIKNKRKNVFLILTLFISLLVGILTPFVYKFDYSFGQNDLMKFAQIAKDNDYTISTYRMGKKYSLLYYGNKKYIKFQSKEDLIWLNNELNKKNNIVIIKNERITNLPVKVKVKGIRYSIIEKE